jgi:hypothetical protein
MDKNFITAYFAWLRDEGEISPEDYKKFVALLRKFDVSKSHPHHKDTSSGSLRITWLEGDGG